MNRRDFLKIFGAAAAVIPISSMAAVRLISKPDSVDDIMRKICSGEYSPLEGVKKLRITMYTIGNKAFRKDFKTSVYFRDTIKKAGYVTYDAPAHPDAIAFDKWKRINFI